MDSREYWRRREEENLAGNLKKEEQYRKELNSYYDSMMDQIQKEIDGFYGKYAKAERITLAEAKKRVSRLDIEAYERKAAKYVKEKNFSKEANEEMRLYNATMKINRLEMLKANIGLELADGFDGIQKYFDQILTERTLQEFDRQAGILGQTIQDNAEMAHAIVNASFHNARYSDRIWMYQDLMKAELSKLLQEGLIQGKNPRKLAGHLTKLFGVSKSNAERLMRTELARVQTEAQRQSFERNGFTQYEFVALGSACGACKGLDGKHFKVDGMMPGENAPPMHPNCRCSVAAYEDSEEYERWLDFLDKGGTTEEWEKIYCDMQGRAAPRTAYIKLSDTTDKWAREAKRELLRDEETLSDRKKEIAVVYDEKGNYLFTKRGNGKSVYFTKRELKRMKGKILSHNHPSGGAFSIADWILFNELKLQEIRATTTNGVYYLRRTEVFEKLNINSEELEREFKKVRKEIKKQYQDLYESGTINKTERFLRSSENYNRIFAKQMGLEFGRERFDE